MSYQISKVRTNIYVSNKHCTVLKLYSSKNPEKNEAATLFSTLIIIRNISSEANQNIIMISEGSCDTEDWSNDAVQF